MRARALLATTLVLAACSKDAALPGQRHQSKSPVVARIGKVELREEDLLRAMTRDPGASPERFEKREARRELIEGLVRFELLAQAAERAGWTKDPDAIHALQQIAVTKLLNQKLGALASPEGISRAVVEREYSARVDSDFTLPPAARVRHLRVADRKLAESLAARARALSPADDAGFAQLSREYSQDSDGKVSGGDLGYLDERSKSAPALVQAALRLDRPGEIAGPFESEGGYEILRLVARRGAVVSPLASVEEQLRQRIYRERRSRAIDDLIAQLRRETPVEIVQSPQ